MSHTQKHKDRLAEHGRVELVGSYAGQRKKAFYKCLAHGDIFEAWPGNVARGEGLKCCKKAYLNEAGETRRKEAELTYDRRLAQIGRVVRVGKYTGRRDSLKHKCLIHGEVHEAVAGNCLVGRGLACCGRQARLDRAEKQKAKFSKEYPQRLASIGRVECLEEYIDATTPILHRCLLHGELSCARPKDLLHGSGLACCRDNGSDSIEHALAGTNRFSKAEASSLYVYELINHSGFLKPGIARNCEARADAEYGPQVCSWERDHRTLVFLPEQVLLRATRLVAYCPSALAGWRGATEVRRMEADALVDMSQELMDELDSCANPWEFAIAHGLLTPAQEKRAQVLIRAGVTSEAELASVGVVA